MERDDVSSAPESFSAKIRTSTTPSDSGKTSDLVLSALITGTGGFHVEYSAEYRGIPTDGIHGIVDLVGTAISEVLGAAPPGTFQGGKGFEWKLEGLDRDGIQLVNVAAAVMAAKLVDYGFEEGKRRGHRLDRSDKVWKSHRKA
jgi:hypothetical protein